MIRTAQLLFLALVLVPFAGYTQSTIDCTSGRYDAEVFSAVTTTSNLVYGSAPNSSGTTTQLFLNIYEPTGDTATVRPLIVWAHGGSFVTGTRNDPDIVQLCQRFAKRGYVCASIEYRLGIPFPPSQAGATQAVFRATQDMKAAIRYFRKDAATANLYRIDPNTIFAGGSSAGAFMSLHLAYLDDPAELPSSIDTVALGNLEGNSGNPGYPSNVNAVVNLCGALGDKNWLNAGDEPLCSMHGTIDNTVPYATSTIYLYGVYPIMVVDGSYSVNERADVVGLPNVMYTYFGANHVPYLSGAAYMDTTVKFVSNFLYGQLGCSPSDPNPLPNTFLSTGVQQVANSDMAEIFPNPATYAWHVRSSLPMSYVTLQDLSGRVVMTRDLENLRDFEITADEVESGIYLMDLVTPEGVIRKKVVRN